MKSLFAGVRLLLQKKHPASQLAEIETRNSAPPRQRCSALIPRSRAAHLRL